MVSNYQPLQTVFAISESEYHTREIKTEEQFSFTVTIVDAATQQPLDCVLLLHGEKPPEVTCRTLFSYIAVQVSYRDAHGFHPYPPYHVESKLCEQGKLPLIFCFHQPGTVCNIHLSVHSIVDSEWGVVYMYHFEDCDCNVQVIDSGQHVGVKTTDRRGVVRMKEPPLLRYTGPLATKKFHKIERQFIKMYLSPNYKQILQHSKQLVDKNGISADIKVFALCWEALSEAVQSNSKHAEEVLRDAWKRGSQPECENGLLLQGTVLRHLAFMQYAQDNNDKALEYILGAKNKLSLAAPFNETALTLYTKLRIKTCTLFSKHQQFSTELSKSIEKEYELLLEHAKYMEDYEILVVCNFFTMKARFHLRSDLITDKLPPEKCQPSPDDLKKAEECLNRVSLDILRNLSNYYTVRYYCTLSDLHIWKQQYNMAVDYLEKARELHYQIELNPSMHFDRRFKLIDGLNGDNMIDFLFYFYFYFFILFLFLFYFMKLCTNCAMDT